MGTHTIFLDLFLILVTARILGEFFARSGIPSVLGEVSAGLLLGVSFLGWTEPSHTLRVLAEIGIVLLLFEIGLETDVHRLVQSSRKSFIVALFGAFFPFAGAFIICTQLFGLDPKSAMFAGGTLMATSIGITLRVLKDIHQEQSGIAQIVIGAAVIDDIMGVIMLVFIYDYATTQHFTLYNTASIAAAILFFLLIAPVAANLFSHQLRKFALSERVPGTLPTMIIALILLLSYLSGRIGAPEILGSFAAGIALSRRFFLPFGLGIRHDKAFLEKVQGSMTPISQLFTPIFFVMIGLTINLNLIRFDSPAFWEMALLLTVIAMLGKYAGAFLVHQNCRMNQTLIGISMIPRGEVGLIFIEIGYLNGIIDTQLQAVLLFVVIITTIVPPFLLKWLFRYECAE